MNDRGNPVKSERNRLEPTFHPAKESQLSPKVPQHKLFVSIKSFSKGPSDPIAGSGDLMARFSVAGIGFPWR
jgi:hypothetical protein